MEVKRMKYNIYFGPITLRKKRFKPLYVVFIGICRKAYRTLSHFPHVSFEYWGPRDCLGKTRRSGPQFLFKSYQGRAPAEADSSGCDSRKAGRGAVHIPWPSPVPFAKLLLALQTWPGIS